MEEKIKKILDQLPVRTDTLITGFQLFLCIVLLFFASLAMGGFAAQKSIRLP